MDTFSPPFEPQNPPPAQKTNNSWLVLLITGIVLSLAGVAGYIYIWFNG